MGYRSEVALALTQDAAKLFKAICDHNSGLKSLIEDCDTTYGWEESEIEQGYTTKLHWTHIKWYDGYLEIDQIQEFMNNVDEEEWHFLRIGEETEDIDQQGAFWESDMYITRAISL